MTEETRKVALITGITGQDGSYLAELLLGKGYTVSLDWNVSVSLSAAVLLSTVTGMTVECR